jgi:glutamate dehydrogenase
VLRRDPFGRFISAIAWLPRDTFDTRLRERIGAMLARACGGHLSAWYIALGDSPLARVHYIIGTDPARLAELDEAALEAAVAQAARGFPERLSEALAAERGEAAAAALLARWREAFPPPTASGDGGAGIADLHLADARSRRGRPRGISAAPPGAGRGALTLRLASPDRPLPLSDALPAVREPRPPRRRGGCPTASSRPAGLPWLLHAYRLDARRDAAEEVFPALTGALSALLDGAAEADGFNRLVLRAGLDWRECWLLRAMYRWLKQVGFPFAQESVEGALAAHPRRRGCCSTSSLPASTRTGRAARRRRSMPPGAPCSTPSRTRTRTASSPACIGARRGAQDQLLPGPRLPLAEDRQRRGRRDAGPAALARGLRPFAADGGRASARRAGGAGRASAGPTGGRISAPRSSADEGPARQERRHRADRREGRLRPEEHPGRARGLPGRGRRLLPPAGPRAARHHRQLSPDGAVPPARVVRRDGDDPYMVVAADKGTASFSDIANGLSAEYGFWLGDAFASGGSAGYDHKGMGITARGAWVMVARHFAELGHDIFAEEFTCAGVGDMSGDVFGNGLLISPHTKLVAAFDHRHIFLDPTPDPAASFAERQRLFALPRSSWADYDCGKISAGGGVFPRASKRIALSARARELLGIEEEQPEPAAVIRAILRAPVDLLYFGGIGTYVKAGTESQAEAGDRANDAVRVDGRELRARVVGEGANLAVTRRGGVEYAAGRRAHQHGRAGQLGRRFHQRPRGEHQDPARRRGTAGAMTRPQRDALLREMTDEVAELVLRDNAQQALAVSLEERAGAEALPGQAALMLRLEAAGVLDRAVAGLPDAAAMTGRIAAGEALARPGICALLPLAKLWLTEAIEESDLPDDPVFAPMLLAYFPRPLQARFPEMIARHRLRRELVATAIANEVANRLGCAALGRLAAAADPVTIARAAWLAGEVFALPGAADAADASAAPAGARLDLLLALRRLQEEAALGLLDAPRPLELALAALRPGVEALVAGTEPGPEAAAWRAAGLPEEAVALASAAGRLAAAPVILQLAGATGAAPEKAAAAWSAIGADYGIEALRGAAHAAPAPGPFGPRARAALLADLGAIQARFAAARLAGTAPRAEPPLALAREAAMAGDLAAIGVAVRALAAVA